MTALFLLVRYKRKASCGESAKQGGVHLQRWALIAKGAVRVQRWGKNAKPLLRGGGKTQRMPLGDAVRAVEPFYLLCRGIYRLK